MAGRKYYFKSLTADDLEKIGKMYPKAVEIIRVPVYSQLRMIAECGAPLPEGVILELADDQEDDGQLLLGAAPEPQINAPKAPVKEKSHA